MLSTKIRTIVIGIVASGSLVAAATPTLSQAAIQQVPQAAVGSIHNLKPGCAWVNGQRVCH